MLDEFVSIYSGIKLERDYYGLIIYPYMDATGYFMEDLKKKTKFPQIIKILPKKIVGCVIMR